ncbi:hypothetical protein E2C01_102266 [Portunus trituberculatus]|uniref:Uncharacterized protein n=1 Tax=Portunus trituberculatus TaxID=210409 RepID=A0A5B7K7Q2_PORTR|nr:hypothetical protein [Portunus trituberculatus]
MLPCRGSVYLSQRGKARPASKRSCCRKTHDMQSLTRLYNGLALVAALLPFQVLFRAAGRNHIACGITIHSFQLTD